MLTRFDSMAHDELQHLTSQVFQTLVPHAQAKFCAPF